MGISFSTIPAGNGIHYPLFVAEVDNSQAYTDAGRLISLIIAQKLASGTATADVPFMAAAQTDVDAKCGRASQAARMYTFFRKANPSGELWIIPVVEPSGGTARTGTITVTGTATANGTIALRVAGQRLAVGVATGDTATVVATAIKDAINAMGTLPVTATNSAGVVTWTCRWKGETGGDIQFSDSYLGAAAGEKLPGGVALAYAETAAGAGVPDLTAALAALGDDQYDFIVHPFNDTASLTDIGAALNDTDGRWSPLSLSFGHAFTALRGTFNDLVTFGDAAADDPHQTVAAVEDDVQNPVWEYVASRVGAQSQSLQADITQPTRELPLPGILPPRRGYNFNRIQIGQLTSYGIGTSYNNGKNVYIAVETTLYKRNSNGDPDESYLLMEDMFKHVTLLRRLRAVVMEKFGRCAVANDGQPIASGRKVVTPSLIRGTLLNEYKKLEKENIVENSDAFAANLVVERDPDNPRRINVLYPPDITNGLYVFAVLYQFRLQYQQVIN